MKFFGRFLNPLIVFIAIQISWVALLVFWIIWFVDSHMRLRALAERFSPELLQGGIDWFILVEGILLLVAILAGVYVIFLFWRRQSALLHMQRNFIAQVSHELKSPLASLRLHLETIRRRRPGPARMDVFLDTMLADTDRLGTLIDNLLAASRLEQRAVKLPLHRVDFSDFVAAYFRKYKYSLPKAGQMEIDIEPDLFVSIETEAMETVFRNLLENALLYSESPPSIGLRLRRRDGKAFLTISDRGRGLERKELKKVFHMFYRVRPDGEAIRGSGLGLPIVRAIIRLHGGRVWLESAGKGQGTTACVLLPLKAPAKKKDTA
ncbi:MAG: HAMP domain-containing sensor histidine kinase [Desulfuromonadales bacterium]